MIVSGGGAEGETEIPSASLAVCAGELESVTLTVKLNWPADAGVPEITPVLAFRLTPGGGAPEVTDQAYGCVPPDATNPEE